MRVRRSKISLFITFFCLGSPSWSRAQEQLGADPCLTDERCNNLYEAALNLSKAGQYNAALQNYEKAYDMRPIPWLLINIGRIHQKMGKPKEALAAYQKFLESSYAQADPEMLVTARQYKRQAEQDLSNPKQLKVIMLREERAPRPLWRLLLGSALLGGGVGMLIPGVYNLAVDGKCVEEPVPPALACPTIYAGATSGAPLLTVGALSIVAGIVTVALPGKLTYRPVSAPQESPSPSP